MLYHRARKDWGDAKSLRSRLPVVTRVLRIGLGVLLSMSPAMAQPPERGVVVDNTPARAVIAAVSGEWKVLREEVGALEATNPAQAIARYQEFYEERGHEAPEIAVQIASLIAQMHWQGLNDRTKAIEVYEWALQEYGRHPAGLRLKQELELLQGTHKLDIARIGQSAGGAAPLLALIERLSAAQVSNAQADEWWRASGVPVADLLQALQTAGTIEKRTEAARPRLIGLVARHGPELVQEPEKLPEKLQYLLAEYYTSVKDPRAEGIYRQLLAKLKEQGPPQAREVEGLWGLFEYYMAMGQPEQAADELMKAPEYTTLPYGLGNSALRAARQYRALGKTEKAEAAYAQTMQSGYGWATGIALTEQARALMSQGKIEEARKLLKMPISGPLAEQIEPVKIMLLADSYYETGDLAQAQTLLQEAIAKHKADTKPVVGHGLEGTFSAAEARLAAIERWIKEPIQVEPKELHITLDDKQPQDKPLSKSLLVRTFRPVLLTASANIPGVSVHVMPIKTGDQPQMRIDNAQMVIVNIAPETKKEDLRFTLVLSSPEIADFQAQVPVRVQVSQEPTAQK